MAYARGTATVQMVGQRMGAGRAIWVYMSGDARATVEGSGYFTDADRDGMKVGDVVIVIYTTGYVTTIHAVSAIASGAATINAAVLA